ncbi:MAG: ABC transporter permease [Anaerolineales bacterium]
MQKSHSKSLSAAHRGYAETETSPGPPAAPAFSGLNTALLLLFILLVGWELLVRWRQVPVYILPAPSQILLTLAQNPGVYLQASLVTLLEAFFGLLLGAFAGCAAAIGLGLWPRLEQGVMTLAIFVKSTPLVAIAPLLTIWLGFGVLPKIIITALLTFFPVLVNMVSGLNAADTARLDTLRSWHASRWEVLRHVRLPEALPYFFAALKVSGPLALIGAVVAEWTGASGGLGRLMWLAYTNLNLPYLFAAVFILATSGIVIYSLVHWLEHRLVFWER